MRPLPTSARHAEPRGRKPRAHHLGADPTRADDPKSNPILSTHRRGAFA
jgi:hypothetical protein